MLDRRPPKRRCGLCVLLAALPTEEEAATHEGNQQNNRSDTLHNKPPRRGLKSTPTTEPARSETLDRHRRTLADRPVRDRSTHAPTVGNRACHRACHERCPSARPGRPITGRVPRTRHGRVPYDGAIFVRGVVSETISRRARAGVGDIWPGPDVGCVGVVRSGDGHRHATAGAPHAASRPGDRVRMAPGGDRVAWFADPDGNILALTGFTAGHLPFSRYALPVHHHVGSLSLSR